MQVSMETIIDTHLEKIKALCQQHKVARLFVFGSVLAGEFDQDSDIDFIVDFEDVDLYEYTDNYFDLKESLEKLLESEVDLLENKAIKNPYLRKSIDANKKLIHLD